MTRVLARSWRVAAKVGHTTFFRVVTIIPVAIVLSMVSGATQTYSGGGTGGLSRADQHTPDRV